MNTTLPITGITAGLLALVYFRLALNVIKLRWKYRISLGDGGHEDLLKAIRAHGNFAEYTPISLLLLAGIELNNAPIWLVLAFAVVILTARVLHGIGLPRATPQNFKLRMYGMQLTLYGMVALAIASIAYGIWSWFC